MVWTNDQTSQNIPLGPNLVQSKALTLFSSVKDERSEKAAEQKFEASKHWFMSFKERSHFHYMKVQGKPVNADVAAAVSYLEDLTKITNDSGYTEQHLQWKLSSFLLEENAI